MAARRVSHSAARVSSWAEREMVSQAGLSRYGWLSPGEGRQGEDGAARDRGHGWVQMGTPSSTKRAAPVRKWAVIQKTVQDSL